MMRPEVLALISPEKAGPVPTPILSLTGFFASAGFLK
jgi:hypothetical protein